MTIASHSRLWLSITIATIVIAVGAIGIFGFNLGIDFTGGSLMEVEYAAPTTQSALADALQKVTGVDLGTPVITPLTATHYTLRFRYLDTEAQQAQVSAALKGVGNFSLIEFTTIGPSIGATLKEQSVRALSYACMAIVLYVAASFRDRRKESNFKHWFVGGFVALLSLVSEFMMTSPLGQWLTFAAAVGIFALYVVYELMHQSISLKYGIAAILGLLHDIVLVLGAFAFLGIFGIEMDSLIVTALLVILGHSVIDTIVVFDRLRENLKFQKQHETYVDTANKAITQTMARSINSSLTVVIVILALLFFGAASIHSFMLALLIGIVSGTWSSVFVAPSILVEWEKARVR